MTCPSLIRENQFVSTTTGRKYFATDIKPDEVYCRLQNYICLLTCTHCGIQYVGESITALNLRTNIHRRGKSGGEISIDYYRNVCKNKSFSIQITEKLPGNGYENGIKDNAIIYRFGLNERTKFMNKNSLMGKLFPSLPRYGDCFIDKRTWSKITNRDLSFDIEFFFSF